MHLDIVDQNIPSFYKRGWIIFFFVFFLCLGLQCHFLEKKTLVKTWMNFECYEWKSMNRDCLKANPVDWSQKRIESIKGIGTCWVYRITNYQKNHGIFWKSDLKKIPSMNHSIFSKLKKYCY